VMATPGNTATGTVMFQDSSRGLLVTAEISGLTPSQSHGFHVHQHGYSGSNDATCTGGHFDPAGTSYHALPGYNGAHHAGDMGVLVADENGVARYSATFSNMSVAGRHAVLGRAVIVHALADDGGQPTGNAGGRIGVGNIAISAH
jgi:Cu-Zn family superoxide dismutase